MNLANGAGMQSEISSNPGDINKRITKQLAVEMKSKMKLHRNADGSAIHKAIKAGNVLGSVIDNASSLLSGAFNNGKTTKSVDTRRSPLASIKE